MSVEIGSRAALEATIREWQEAHSLLPAEVERLQRVLDAAGTLATLQEELANVLAARRLATLQLPKERLREYAQREWKPDPHGREWD